MITRWRASTGWPAWPTGGSAAVSPTTWGWARPCSPWRSSSSYAAEGPSLVVAPTSVSTNWQTEVTRFTPTLNIVTLTGKDRDATIKELGPFDLLITTYTLLQQEMDLLATVPWQTIILDEAQAIKNAATKRSKAAMSLQARFKLITTGTPIENHLGELWNLFHFINPGLLGSLNSFNERFAIPIERYQDREARLKLKKLIRPFILRRIKSEVLEELPAAHRDHPRCRDERRRDAFLRGPAPERPGTSWKATRKRKGGTCRFSPRS